MIFNIFPYLHRATRFIESYCQLVFLLEDVSLMTLTAKDVLAAERRIRPVIRETFVDYSPYLSQNSGASVFLKHEEQQVTGSFKFRGASNVMRSLSEAEKAAGVVCASTGNHGLGVAHAARQAGVAAAVFLPKATAAIKKQNILALGATLHEVAGDCLVAESQARAEAKASGRVFVSPYNDPLVIAGQGTLGVELAQQLPNLDKVFVAVGGGGLIGGIGLYMKSVNPSITVVGCWPAHAPAMHACLQADRVLEAPEEPTLSESTAGGVEAGSITFPLCQQVIDAFVLVSEPEIVEALRCLAEQERCLVEGAAAVAVAGFLKTASACRGERVAIILCGRNIAMDVWRNILC